MDIRSEYFTNYFGLLQISTNNQNTKECLGLFTNLNKLVTSKNCLTGFDIDLSNEKASEKFSFSFLFGVNFSKKINSMERYEVVKIVPVCSY